MIKRRFLEVGYLYYTTSSILKITGTFVSFTEIMVMKILNSLIKSACFIVLVTTLFKIEAFAQEVRDTSELKEIVISGNRISTRYSRTTQDVQVLTSTEINRLPVSSVNELLAYIGGVDIRQRGPMGVQADVSIDGGTFEQTLVLVDGIKIINAQTAHNMMNIPIPMSAIERIEILRGSAARIYGINAISGAINIITKNNQSSGVEADIYTGSSLMSRDSREGKGVYAGVGMELTGYTYSEEQSHLMSVAKENSNGHRYNSDADRLKLFYSGEYRQNINNSYRMMAGYTHAEFGANGFYAAPGDSTSAESVKTALMSLSSRHNTGRLTISPRVSYRYDEDDYRYYRDNPSVARSVHYTSAAMAEVNAGIRTVIGEIGVGWESRFETIHSSNIGAHQRYNHGFLAEYKGQYGENWILATGAYLNYNTDFGWQLYPGLNLAWLPDNHWKISTSIGTGQRIPSFTDLYLNQAPGNVGNPDLKPENSWDYDLNISYKVHDFKFETGFFRREVTGFIDWVRNTDTVPYSPLNLRTVKMTGLYLRGHYDVDLGKSRNLNIFVGYNYLQPDSGIEAASQSKYVLESLKHQIVAGVNFSVDRWMVQVTQRYIKRELNTPYNVMDLRLNYRINKFSVYMDVTNILNSEYLEAGAVPMPSRWFKIGVRYKS